MLQTCMCGADLRVSNCDAHIFKLPQSNFCMLLLSEFTDL